MMRIRGRDKILEGTEIPKVRCAGTIQKTSPTPYRWGAEAIFVFPFVK
jgi:hypothetical protein